MKNLITSLFLALFIFAGTTIHAQTKKTTTTPPAKKATEKVADKKTNPTTEKVQKSNTWKPSSADYSTAIGVKFLYGLAITGKHFFNQNNAGEAIVRYQGFNGVGSDINLTALYEYHGNISGAEGLRWYVGGGAYVGNFSWDADYNYADDSGLYFGISGVAGLEYKFKKLPIAISADWQPVFLLKDYYNNSGFGAENGGFGVKYTF